MRTRKQAIFLSGPIGVGKTTLGRALAGSLGGRFIDESEMARIKIMIAEGYGVRPFSDLIVDTDQDTFEGTLAVLTEKLQRLMRVESSLATDTNPPGSAER